MSYKYKNLQEYSRNSIENIIGKKITLEELPKIFVTDNITFDLSLIKVISHLGAYNPDGDTNQQVYFIAYKDFYYFLLVPEENAYKFNIYDSNTLNYVLKSSISLSLFPCLIPKNEDDSFHFIYMNALEEKIQKKYSCPMKLFNDIKWILKIMENN